MKVADLQRSYRQVATNIEDEGWMNAVLAFNVGWLCGGDNTQGAALLIALYEAKFGNTPGLVAIKLKVGLAGPIEVSEFGPAS